MGERDQLSSCLESKHPVRKSSGDIVRQLQDNTQGWILAAKVGQRTSLMFGMIYHGSLF